MCVGPGMWFPIHAEITLDRHLLSCLPWPKQLTTQGCFPAEGSEQVPPVPDCVPVPPAGLVALLHHQLALPLSGTVRVHVPVRKRVECRTRDVHQVQCRPVCQGTCCRAGAHGDSALPRVLLQNKEHCMWWAAVHVPELPPRQHLPALTTWQYPGHHCCWWQCPVPTGLVCHAPCLAGPVST